MASHSVSSWSIASAVFLTLAMLSAAGSGYFASQHATGPADGAVITLLVVTGAAVAWLCGLLGAIVGVLGVRKSRGHARLAATVLALNVLILLLPLLWCLLLVLTQGRAY
jgi:hypothetical protein